MKKALRFPVFAVATVVFLGSSSKEPVMPEAKDYYTLWNQCEVLTWLQEYVADVTNPASENHICLTRYNEKK